MVDSSARLQITSVALRDIISAQVSSVLEITAPSPTGLDIEVGVVSNASDSVPSRSHRRIYIIAATVKLTVAVAGLIYLAITRRPS